ncbi:MAG: DNA polymerase III subunit chi [Caulobacteraceae bacterium]|nr:DNA polymerase III subunit chi [Caulobacter sp.]
MAEAPAPCEVWFYHLERSTADDVLPDLLDRTLARGWRALVVAPDAARQPAISERLWGWKPESFLAHGCADQPDAERQPILLSDAAENLNGAQVLVLMDGAELPPLEGFTRCLDLFDGREEDAVQAARFRWRAARGQGATVSYWRQGERGWEKQA